MMTLQPAFAQSELVATDDAGGTQAHVSGISSLDFYDNGTYRVQNVWDADALTFLAAHTEYWRNREVFAHLHDALA